MRDGTLTLEDPLAPLVDSLHAEGRPRVWSVIVTILGDAARPRGGWMPSARIAALLETTGINAGAMRAALSRLTRDGWLERARDGRTSAYRLRPERGREEAEASRRIYAPPAPAAGAAAESEWVVAFGVSAPLPRALMLAPGVALWPASEALPAGQETLRVRGTMTLGGALPLPPAMAQARAAMRADLDALSPAACELLDPDRAMAARTLLLHRWRRLVLRYPDLPAGLEGPDAPDLRAAMAERYRRLLPASERWLDLVGPGFPAMPAADGSARRRFAEV